MIHPPRDFSIALAMLVGGVAAFLWGLPTMIAGTPGPQGVAGVVGGLVGFFGALMTLNFGAALYLQRRLLHGSTAIARWRVDPTVLRAWLDGESRRGGPRPEWRPNGHDLAHGIVVAFGPESVSVGGRFLSIPSSGLQAMRAVALHPGSPPTIAFATHLYAARGASAPQIAAVSGLLRVPAPDAAQAAAVLRYYEEVLAGRIIVAPRRWTIRIVIGLLWAGAGAIAVVAGQWLMEAAGHRTDGPWGTAPLIAQIAGSLSVIAGLAVAAMAWSFRRRQRGRR